MVAFDGVFRGSYCIQVNILLLFFFFFFGGGVNTSLSLKFVLMCVSTFCVNVFYLYVLVKSFEMQLLKALYKIKFIIINTFSKKQMR